MDDKRASRRVGEALDAYLASEGLGEVRDLAAITTCWSDAVGLDVAQHANPVGLRSGELVVAVDHPAWATELSFLRERILNALAEQVGRVVVTEIKVNVRDSRRLD